jgi:hypothetical protein
MFLFRFPTFWHLCFALLFSGMKLKNYVVQKLYSSFSFQGRFEIPWLESLGLANQREETTCHWNACTSSVIYLWKGQESQVVTVEVYFPLCTTSRPALAMRSAVQMDGWERSEAITSCWFVFSHPFPCCEGKTANKGGRSVVTMNYYSFTGAVTLWTVFYCCCCFCLQSGKRCLGLSYHHYYQHAFSS